MMVTPYNATISTLDSRTNFFQLLQQPSWSFFRWLGYTDCAMVSWSRVNESGLTNKSLMFFVTIHDWFLLPLQLHCRVCNTGDFSLLISRVDLPGVLKESTAIPRSIRVCGRLKRSYTSNSYTSRQNTCSNASKFIEVYINRNQITEKKSLKYFYRFKLKNSLNPEINQSSI